MRREVVIARRLGGLRPRPGQGEVQRLDFLADHGPAFVAAANLRPDAVEPVIVARLVPDRQRLAFARLRRLGERDVRRPIRNHLDPPIPENAPVAFDGQTARLRDRRGDRRVAGIDSLERHARCAEDQLGLFRCVGEPRGEDATRRNPDRRRGVQHRVAVAEGRISRWKFGKDRRFPGIGRRRNPDFEHRFRDRSAARQYRAHRLAEPLAGVRPGSGRRDDDQQGRREPDCHRIARGHAGPRQPYPDAPGRSRDAFPVFLPKRFGIGSAHPVGQTVLQGLQRAVPEPALAFQPPASRVRVRDADAANASPQQNQESAEKRGERERVQPARQQRQDAGQRERQEQDGYRQRRPEAAPELFPDHRDTREKELAAVAQRRFPFGSDSSVRPGHRPSSPFALSATPYSSQHGKRSSACSVAGS